jgi:Mrp family chromosome partitioning ATPase
LDDYKQVALAFNEKTINYDVLKREAESNQNIYDILLKEVRETSLISDTRRSNIRIVYEAKLPHFPIKPRKILIILLSIIFSLCFGMGLAFFLEYVDNSVKSPEDVSRHLDMSVLGMIPYDKSLKGKKIPALLTDESLQGERRYERSYYQYDIMTNLLPRFSLMQTGKSGQILMVESTTSGEGKSTVLARSAINLARQGLRVLMVDADVQWPDLHNMFGINGRMGKGLHEAMSKVLSLNMQQGTLDSCSVDDLFSLIALKKQSGRLTFTNDSQAMTAVFDKGCFLHLQSRDVPCSNRLGTMLLNGGVITESQLKDALDRNQRTGLPLGYILLNAGYINQNQLQGPIKLQMEEQLQKLFSWKQGTFAFEPASVKTYEDKRIHFWEDYVPIINRLGEMGGNRFLENEVLSHVISLNEPNLSLLPSGTGSEKSGSLLYFTLLSKFLGILKQHFNVILVDAPPILDTMNSFKPLFSMVDGVIFVIKPGQVSIKDANEAVNCIKESQTKIIGAVLNQAKKGLRYY